MSIEISKKINKKLLLIPLFILLICILILWRGLSLHPEEVPSPFINKPAPNFSLPLLSSPNKNLTQDIFKGKTSLLNVFASWCYACVIEHSELKKIAEHENITLYGLNYKDDPVKAKQWLKQYGNPYQAVLVDSQGLTAINWGVYGTPETFLIDKDGIIRHKFIGPITESDVLTIRKIIK